jgi:peptide deformylase
MYDKNIRILQLGHPILRKIAQPIIDITSTQTQFFLNDLLQFVIDKKGMGIAAPQVGVSERIFIMCSRPNIRYPYAPEMKPTVIINPEITYFSTETEKDWEGCLSVPGIRALVPRHTSIKVKFTSRQGDVLETEYSGFLARIFQHEFDHLQGMVFLDRIENTHEIMMEQEWLEMINQS